MDLASFADQWIADWNSHDLDRILAHYSPEIRFRSPFAERMVGTGEVVGLDALRAYWGPALANRPGLTFTLKTAFIGYRAIAIHYGDEQGRDVVETLYFGADGRVIAGSGCYA